jgi:hypothetical protein
VWGRVAKSQCQHVHAQPDNNKLSFLFIEVSVILNGTAFRGKRRNGSDIVRCYIIRRISEKLSYVRHEHQSGQFASYISFLYYEFRRALIRKKIRRKDCSCKVTPLYECTLGTHLVKKFHHQSRRKWEDIIKIDLRECQEMECIHLTEDVVQ